jgi:PAS domain S-box-containing protein
MKLFKEENIGTLNLISFISVVMVLMLTAGYYFTSQRYESFKQDAQQIEENYLREQKVLLRQRVQHAKNYIRHQQESIQSIMDNYVRGRVYEGYETARLVYERYKEGHTPEEQQQHVYDALSVMQWDNGQGYYFVCDLDGIMQLHPNNPELEKTDVRGLQDSRGNYIVRDMIVLARQEKEGHYQYYWEKPGETTNMFLKRSYVKLFEPFNWVIGAGIYMDEVETLVKNQTIEWLRHSRFDNDGYFTIVDYDGIAVMNPLNPGREGEQILTVTATNGTKVIFRVIRAGCRPGGDFVRYPWKKPSSGEIVSKIVYSDHIDSWRWIISSGVYMDDLEAMIAQKHSQLKAAILVHIKKSLVLFLLFLSVAILVSYLISRFITTRILSYRTKLAERARHLEQLNRFDKAILYLDMRKSIHSAMEFISGMDSFARISLAIFNKDMTTVTIYAVRQDMDQFSEGEVIPIEDTRFGVHDVNRPIYRRDLREDAHLFKVDTFLLDSGIHSTFSVPLVAEGSTMGMLNCGLEAIDGFSNDTRRLLTLMAARLAQVLHNARLYAAQEESRIMLETVMDTIPHYIFWKDVNSVYLGCNRNYARLAGLEHPDDIIGKTDYDLFWSEQDAHYFRKDDRRVIDADTPEFHMIETMTTDEGGIMWRDVSKVPMHDKEGNVIGVLGTYEDITERKQIKEDRERLITAVEHAAEGIMITDSKANIQYVNPAFEQITGYSADEVVGKKASILKSGRQGKTFYDEMWKTLNSGNTWKGHITNRRKDGMLYEEDSAISPITDYMGNIISFVAVKRDVTEQLRLQKELRHVQKMEAIGTLAGGIAHDFNNILMALMGYADLALEEAPADTRSQQYLREVLKAGDRAKALVKQILAFSRKGGRNLQPLQLNLIIKEVLKMVLATAPVNITVTSKLADNNAMVMADPAQMHQVVLNIIRNAVQALPAGNGRLDITCEQVELTESACANLKELMPGMYAKLVVKDSGSGISPAIIDRVFEPFFTTKKLGEGTGLGLAIVHGIVTSLDGAVHISSEPGKGTTVVVYIPGIIHTAAAEPEKKPAPNRGQGRILFVDDEEDIVTICSAMLQSLGYEFTGVTSGAEALALFQSDPYGFDLVITDQKMPGMNGIYLARELLQVNPDIPIILCTGYSEIASSDQAAALGFQRVLLKPILKQEMAQVLSAVLHKTDRDSAYETRTHSG